jgi:hypothetical protein
MEAAMTAKRMILSTLVLCILPAATATAQTGEIRTGAIPPVNEKAVTTTAVGQTKKPSRDAGSVSDRSRSPGDVGDGMIRNICIGCEPDRSTLDTVTTNVPPRTGGETWNTKLERLRKLPEPSKQGDLDTFSLASAHRERAESVQEKTNGLWQSWLVSVCEGCGDQKPAKAWNLQDRPSFRLGSVTPDRPEGDASSEKTRPAEPRQVAVHHHGAFEADLSPENVGSIRRMPQR